MNEKLINFLFQLAIILISTKVLGILMRKIGLPQVLGSIIAGIFIGPAIWELIFETNSGMLLPIDPKNEYLKAFAEVGVIFVMFTAGLETRIEDIKEAGLASFLIALGGVLLPLGAGVGLGALFLPDKNIFNWLFVGVIMTATSVGITVEVLRELNKLQTKVGTIIVSAAIIDDVLGIIVLSIVLSLANTGSGATSLISSIDPTSALLSIVGILSFFVVAVILGFVVSKLFKYIEKRSPHTRRIPILSIAVCLLYAFMAEKVFGVADITGAFIAGLVLSTNHASAEYVDRKVTISSYTIFAPIFFANIGIGISFSNFTLDILWFALAFVAMAILTKIIGCGGIAKAFKFRNRDCAKIGVGMIARGEVALIVVNKGISGGLIEAKYLAIVVLLVLVSSIIAPILLKALHKGEDTGLPLNRLNLEEGHFE